MPIYEYRCENGHTFEVMQRMTDDPVSACSTCEAPVQRVFHPVAVHFKGKGFYNTDYGTRRRNREMERSGEGGGDKAASTSSDGGGSGEGKGSSDSKAPSTANSASSSSSSSSSSSEGSGKKPGQEPASRGD
jgi:putative FmdB family regulatory protein